MSLFKKDKEDKKNTKPVENEKTKEAEPLKFREWFTLKGIRAEIKNVHWLTRKELFQNSATVLIFCFLFGLYFYASDAVIAFILTTLGMK